LTKLATHPIPARKDVLYIMAFIAGALVPFTGGWLLAQATNPFLPILLPGGVPPSQTALLVFNIVPFVSVVAAYVGGLALLFWVYRRFQVHLSARATLMGLAMSAIVIVLGVWVSMQQFTYQTIDPVWLDIALVILFGAGYMLGLFVAMRKK